ncbi:MAG TPA: carboxypeptidase regulatory-like domain-containing protein [Planctomycetota bacterium]|jgi:hypothetical protein|nr:carboxypeptidase regulatory-like domain-containing protein [Planctomycetota bacterium]
MKGSAKPALLLLALLVTGAVAAVYFVTKPVASPGGPAPAAADRGSERPGPDRTPELPGAAPSPNRAKADMVPRGAATSGDGGSYANALVGEVKDDQGNGVEGAEVSAQKGPAHAFLTHLMALAPDGPVLRVRTDKAGRFRLASLPPAESYVVRATHKDHPPVEVTNVAVPAEGEVPLSIVFRSGYALEGTVYDGNRRALPDVALALESSAGGPFASPEVKDRRDVKTDASGRYRFENIPAGQRTLAASGPGFGSRTVPNIQFSGDNRTITQDLVLAEGKRIAGRVVDEVGNGISAARVEATAYSTQEMSKGEGESGPDGSFAIEGLAPGTYAVVASATGYSRETQPRVEAGSEGISIVLGILGTVEGRVLEAASGRGLSSFRLEARKVTQPGSGMFGKTNLEQRFDGASDGRYVFGGLEPGRYALLASTSAHAQGYSSEFEISKGQRVTNVDIALTAGGRLVGRLVDGKTSKGVAGATLTTRDNGYQDNPFVEIFRPFLVTNVSSSSIRTGSDGSYVVDHLMPGTYQVEIDHPSYTKKYVKDLVVQEGKETPVSDIAMFPGATIRGVAVSAGGAPLAQAQVTVRPSANSTPATPTQRQIRTDANGRFLARNLPPGEYDVSVATSTDANPNPFEMLIQWQKSKKTVVLNEGDDVEVQLILAN